MEAVAVMLRLKLYALAALAFFAGLLAVYGKGRGDAAAAARRRKLEGEINAHNRINDADLGGGATDAERVKRLHGIADKLGD